ncbi:hypothetical protein M409DRAFT_25423 [Zasmidium cellare ATCC 36951]|uniref:Tat pathway signal sequence n=1 Tax=Zasmidium cellare ATCC 36951 TaxID=1080233 RepID=A0A6A6CAM6_ZASCE|nr:uncharacterized protein M409DRAFT_25423 [Zasmidium cellare ATCC 36951]KAF2164075.1 hypothetical protein M409DRAFT_25423 [Zasmidium cellare ATCC 36951]
MENDSSCEKETLLADPQGRSRSKPQSPPSHPERHRTLLLISAFLITNLLSFLIGCSLNWATVGSTAFSHSTLDIEKDGVYYDMDRKTLHETTFEPFSYVMSKYATPAGGEIDVDAEWEALGANHEVFLIPPGHEAAFDLRPEHVLYAPEMVSHPPGVISEPGYPATIQAIHQLHCLNLLRKSLWFNADYYRNEAKGSWGHNQTDADVQVHVGHCLDAMRQVVMCNADTDVVPLLWFTEQGRTISDFARNKQCRNFESVTAWSEKHQVKALESAVLEPPPDFTLAHIAGTEYNACFVI